MTRRTCQGRTGVRRKMIFIRAWQPSEGYIKNKKRWTEIRRCSARKNRDETADLLLEQVFEGLARIGRTARNRLWKSGGDLRRLLIRRGSGVLLDGGAEFVELAIVLAVFGSDAFGNRLRTFKLRTGIEEAALFAAMQFGVALGAGAAGVEAGGEDSSTIGAARAGYRADHARSARAEMIVLSARTALRRLAFGAGLLFFVAIAIAARGVLPIHRSLRALALRQCEPKASALRQTCTS